MDGVGFGATAAKNPTISFRAAVVAAGGQVAVAMLGHTPKPDAVREDVPVRAADGGLVPASDLPSGMFCAQPDDGNARANQLDDERIAAFCTRGAGLAADLWAERCQNVLDEAARLVTLHTDAILSLSAGLWTRVVIAREEFLELVSPHFPEGINHAQHHRTE